MIHLLFSLLYLSHVVQATSTNTTSSTCPDLDGSYRSIWSILGLCALTLAICLWHTVHPDLPEPGEELLATLIGNACYVILGFLAPEALFAIATNEWFNARQKVIYFHEKGYKWSMTHSYFAENGGFVYCDVDGNVEVIRALEFLELCEKGKIMNPLVTEQEIKDRSKSDAVSKAVFAIQLLWFMLQVAARHFTGLAVTLVELDTLCMAVIAVCYLLLWWNKSLNAGCPHIFYESQVERKYSQEELSRAWKPQPGFLYRLSMSFQRYTKKAQSTTDDEEPFLEANEHSYFRMRKLNAMINKAIQNDLISENASYVALSIAWCVLGALHLAAWYYAFPTEKEKFIWRAAALGLTASGLIYIILVLLTMMGHCEELQEVLDKPLVYFAIVCRVMLAVLMLLSLRVLPCSAHQTISWVEHIPHL